MRTARRLMATGLTMLLFGMTLIIAPAFAADPATADATMPAGPGTVTVKWTGTFQPFANATGSCSGPAEVTEDMHNLTPTVPNGLNKATDLLPTASFSVVADDADVMLTVEGPTDDA